ncbi:MAG: hypothetical protein HYZ44_17745 [Bacteroidetes bacterium]|nr:hypothetical protein [Bacteroidota bacterium]
MIGLIIILNSLPSYGQSHLEKYFNAIRKGQTASFESELWLLQSERDLWKTLISYQKDSIANVRYQTYLLISRLGKESQKPEDRTWAVEQLMGASRNNDSGIVGLAVRELTGFYRNDFSSSFRDSLRVILHQRAKHYAMWLRLVGYIGIKDQTTVIQSQIQDGKLSRSEKWAAHLALSRMGDTEALRYVLDRTRKIGVNDDAVYELFPDLIYTRQLHAVQYLVEALNSDKPSCESADAEISKRQTCAYRIIELLAPVIKDFPLTVDASGDLAVADYSLALQQVRQWFATHPNFKILDSSL